ncbi:MAG: transcriptional repressor LexA [Clostridia bacterium]|nr:transcriptional repressor LexA [Clostridia bacterium]
MAKLGEKDYQILSFIREQLEKRGFPPTVREICAEIGLSSTATVHARLKKLEEHGLIVKDGGKNRTLKIVGEDTEQYVNVPIYGKITAGVPITAIEDISGSFPIPASIARNKELFMLRVEGESMINAAILDGDLILVQRQPTADNGDIAVALINGEEATVKTFYKEDGYIRLQPENDSMEPIILSNVEILGKVIGVFRTL